MSAIHTLRRLGGMLTLLLGFLPSLAVAQIGSDRYASIVVEAQTGRVLSAVAADQPRFPASLTKMMTLYLTFEALQEGRITRQQAVPVSAHAASMQPSKLGLVPGTRITVQQAILALITKSANDVAAALGELLGGTETRFAQMMTLRARSLGMTHTVFRNASGWPDPKQMTTARDMAVLGRRLVLDFPGEYALFSTPSFHFGRRTLPNHNRILTSYDGADGIKTGYTNDSGFNLVASAVRGNVRLIGVVMGGDTAVERDRHMMALLDQGFENTDAPMLASRSGVRMPALVSSAEAASALGRAAASSSSRRVAPVSARMRLPWSIQVGAFATPRVARSAATAAARRIGEPASSVRVEDVRIRNRTHYRAQVTGLTQAQATRACAQAKRNKRACMVIRPEAPRGMASR